MVIEVVRICAEDVSVDEAVLLALSMTRSFDPLVSIFPHPPTVIPLHLLEEAIIWLLANIPSNFQACIVETNRKGQHYKLWLNNIRERWFERRLFLHSVHDADNAMYFILGREYESRFELPVVRSIGSLALEFREILLTEEVVSCCEECGRPLNGVTHMVP